MRKVKIILTIIFSVLLIGDIFLSLGVHVALNRTGLIGNYTEDNTQEYTATVSSVQIIASRETPSIRIYTEEYSAFLQISSVEEPEEIKEALRKGTTIHFRVPNTMKSLMTTGQFVEVVALKSEEVVLLSIRDYNENIRGGISQALNVLCVKACIEFIVVIVCVVLIILERKKDKRQIDNRLSRNDRIFT